MESSDEETISPEKVIDECKTSKQSLADAVRDLRIGKDQGDKVNSDSDSDLSDSEYVCSVCSKRFSGFIPFQQHEKGSKHAKALLKKVREKKMLEKIKVAGNVTEEDEEYLFFIKKPYTVCKPCGKQFGGPESYALHIDSKAHKQKVLQASILDKVRDNGEINVDMLKELYESKITADDDAENLLEDTQKRIASLKDKDEDVETGEAEELECKDCEKIFSGLIPYTQHVMSKVHAKKIKKKKLLQKILPEDGQYATETKVRDLSHLVVEDDILVCKLCSVSFSGPENAMQHLKSKNHSKSLEKYLRKRERKQKAASRVTELAEELSEDDSYQEAEVSLKATASFKPENDSSNIATAKLQNASSDNDSQQKYATASKHQEDSSISASSKRKENASSSDDDNPHNVANPPKAIIGGENKMVEFGQRPTVSSKPALSKGSLTKMEKMDMKDETEECLAKAEEKETLYSYEKYKSYKKIMHSVLKDDTDN